MVCFALPLGVVSFFFVSLFKEEKNASEMRNSPWGYLRGVTSLRVPPYGGNPSGSFELVLILILHNMRMIR